MNEKSNSALEVISRLSETPKSELKPETELVADLGIDSPKALQLLVELEDTIGVEISDGDAARMETVGDILSFYESR